ncbi:MAG: hypothetical protein AMXMBFR7_43580 [Planctomycetota bacterium]
MKQLGQVAIGSSELIVTIDPAQAVFDVRQRRSGTQWLMDRSDRRDLVLQRMDGKELTVSLADARARQGGALSPSEARLEYSDFRGLDSPIAVTVSLSVVGPELNIELTVRDTDPRYRFDSLYYPRSFVLPPREAYWLFPFHGGALLPSNHRVQIGGRSGWKPSLKCHGAVQKHSGFLCLWETPWDIYLGHQNSPREGPRLVPRLLSSLGRFGYSRRLRFVFREKTNYADLIRSVYRPWAERRGYVRTLQQKTAENPRVRDLSGGMILHQLIATVDRRNLSRKVVSFQTAGQLAERIIRETGVRKGCYHLDGWCRQGYDALHPDVFPPLAEAGGEAGMVELSRRVRRLGLHFGLHDNYLLFFPDAERYRDWHAVWGPDLSPVRDQFRAGGMNFVASPPAAREFLIANYLSGQNLLRRRWSPAGKTYSLGFCYLDQYLLSGGSVEEDFNPAHRLTREQFGLGMIENIRIMREDVGCITSSEHMYDFGVPWFDVNGNRGGLMPPLEGDGCIPAPLWNLAFHECLVVTNSTDTPADFALAGLTGALIHYRHGYRDTEEMLSRTIGHIQAAAPLRRLHEEVMYRPCTGSRLLSADGMRQEADFDGITVAADLGRGKLDVEGSKRANGHFDFSRIEC